ncbi:MAG: patatin-like phospholipase family protein [Parvularculaceae bacterium]
MDPILERCRPLAFFSALTPETQSDLVAGADWFSLPGGSRLFGVGDDADALYFVVSGRLVVVRADPALEEREHLTYVRAGDPFGLRAVIAGDRRDGEAYALRDAELVAVPRRRVLRLFETRVDFAAALARTLIDRSRPKPPAPAAEAALRDGAPRVFALVAGSPSTPVEAYAATIAENVAACGRPVATLGPEDLETASGHFGAGAQRDGVVLLPCRVGDDAWYRFALRHADRFLVFARRDARPPKPLPLSPTTASAARRFRLVDVVAVDEGAPSGSLAEWASTLNAARIFQWRGGRGARRLARAIAGRSIGVVLSGGGARAYAHLGAIRALRARGAAIDFIGGASMGAIVAACVAMGWDDEETEARLRDSFVASNPLGDQVLPVIALTRGKIVEERLAAHFGDVRIEDLDRPFFCVSSELTQGALRVHRTGLLRDALRASISLPGVLPPIVDGEALLVDGAVIDNFPTATMRDLHRGLTIGVDVARRGSIDVAPYREPMGFARWVRRNGVRAAPPIVALLMRAATARREMGPAAAGPDILIAPPAEGVEIRDWTRFAATIADGERAAVAVLDEPEARARLAAFSDCLGAGLAWRSILLTLASPTTLQASFRGL